MGPLVCLSKAANNLLGSMELLRLDMCAFPLYWVLLLLLSLARSQMLHAETPN